MGRLRQLRRYGVGFFDFLGTVFVTVILIAAFAVPILDIALGILGRRLGGDMLEVGVVLRVKLAVFRTADLAYRFFGAGRFSAGMPVVDRYGHFGGVARFVGNNYFLLTVCRGENKAAVFIERDRRSVYGDGICIFFGNCNRLRFAVGLAVFNAADYRLNIIKRYAVGTKICYVQAYICIVIIREATAMSYAVCLSSRTP